MLLLSNLNEFLKNAFSFKILSSLLLPFSSNYANGLRLNSPRWNKSGIQFVKEYESYFLINFIFKSDYYI